MKAAKERTARGRATVMAVLAAVAVLASGTAVWSAAQANRLREPGGNVALSDVAATREVRDALTEALKAVFSYDYSNLARTERAARDVLVGAAVNQYERGFARARARARTERLVRTTTVRSVGLRSLSGDKARALALLDQQTLHPGDGNRRESSTAALSVTLTRTGGEWKIARLRPL